MHRFKNGSPKFLSELQPPTPQFHQHFPSSQHRNTLQDFHKRLNFSSETFQALKTAGTCFPIIYSSPPNVPCDFSVPPPKIPDKFNLPVKKPLHYVNEDNHPLMVMDKVAPTAQPTRNEARVMPAPTPGTSNENQQPKKQTQAKGKDPRGMKRSTPWSWDASRSPSPSVPPKRRFPPTPSSVGQYNNSPLSSPKPSFSNKDRRLVPYARQRKDSSAQTHFPPPNAIFINGIPSRNNRTNGSTWERVSVVIWEKYLELRQKPETLRRKLVLKDVLEGVLKEIPTCELHIVGSTITGFGCEGSDVDMCIVVNSSDPDPRYYSYEVLTKAASALKQCEFIRKTEFIPARVPIVKCFDGTSQIEVDLNCNNVVGIRNTHLLKAYGDIDWRVKPLVLIVKLWARYKDINDAKNRSISSYSLTLMVIHFLQCGVVPAVLPSLQRIMPDRFRKNSEIRQLVPLADAELSAMRSENSQSLGELFAGFLDYYAYKFNYEMDAISIRLGRTLPIIQCLSFNPRKNEPFTWKHLCIEEPFDQSNTARAVYDPDVWQRILSVFQSASLALQQTKDLSSVLGT